MAGIFKKGKIYKFIEEGEDLPIESEYKKFYESIDLKKDIFGYYQFKTDSTYFDFKYVPINSGTLALCLGEATIKVPSNDFRFILKHKYYRLLIEDKVVILLKRECNLFDYEEINNCV